MSKDGGMRVVIELLELASRMLGTGVFVHNTMSGVGAEWTPDGWWVFADFDLRRDECTISVAQEDQPLDHPSAASATFTLLGKPELKLRKFIRIATQSNPEAQ